MEYYDYAFVLALLSFLAQNQDFIRMFCLFLEGKFNQLCLTMLSAISGDWCCFTWFLLILNRQYSHSLMVFYFYLIIVSFLGSFQA